MKVLKEWYFQAPWGKVALMSWGNSNGKPILLVHGRQDSLVTFLPLLKLLPDTHHYVGLDLPGHGKSDPLPVGVAIPRILLLAVIEMAIKSLGWQKFIYIAHSMGSELGLYYNAIHPNQIEKIVLLDPGPSFRYLIAFDNRTFIEHSYVNYYDNYEKYNVDNRVYTKTQAIEAVMKNRKMNKAQAELILSRNLIKIGKDKYRLVWDKRLKVLMPLQNTLAYQKELFTRNLPPTLIISSNEFKMGVNIQAIIELLNSLSEQRNSKIITVKGDHDVHFKHPELFIDELNSFLNKSFVVSKI